MKKIQPIKLPQTPITDETFVKQGWRKEVDDENPKEEVYQWILSCLLYTSDAADE